MVGRFLAALGAADQDGRILLTTNRADPAKNRLKFVLLNPGAYFADIVKVCFPCGMVG